MKPCYKVYQDGREFYDSLTGMVIYIAAFKVSDHDMEAAKDARRQFVEWAEKCDIDYEWE